jgi:hypothetical protein
MVVWGVDETGKPVKILVKPDGTLKVEGIVTVSNLDVPLSTRASEATVSSILSKLDITLSSLRDAITSAAPNNKTLADLYERLNSIRTQLDVTLSTRASESTLSSVLGRLDITLSAFRDALRGTGNKTLTDLESDLSSILAKLDVALSTRASESKLEAVRALLDSLENALASVGTDKLRTSLVDPLPPGTNTIGNVNAQVINFPTEYPLPSAQIADLKNVNILREGSYIPFNLTFTAAGTQTIYTPSSGKKAKVLGFYVKCTADVDWEIRYATSQNIICGLPFKGAILMNLIGLETPIGDTDEAIQAYAGGACTIKGWLTVKEV